MTAPLTLARPIENIYVSIYPGYRGMMERSAADALAFAQRRVADGFREPLMLGAMQPGYLGREVVTIADLLTVLCPCGKPIEHLAAFEAGSDDACRVPEVTVR